MKYSTNNEYDYFYNFEEDKYIIDDFDKFYIIIQIRGSNKIREQSYPITKSIKFCIIASLLKIKKYITNMWIIISPFNKKNKLKKYN
jgi:hypothetical protein